MVQKSTFNYLTLRQNVVEIVRSKILNGIYLPGDRIKELELSKELNISRGPIREGLRQLEEEGLVSYETNKGCSVTTLDPKDAWEIYLLRANLEILSLRLCNGDVGKQVIKNMERLYKDMISAAEDDDFNKMISLDLQFHENICRASNSKYLIKLWTSLNGYIYSIFLTVKSANVRNLDDGASRHIVVLDAIKTKDIEIACEAVMQHYLSTGMELLNKKTKEMIYKIY